MTPRKIINVLKKRFPVYEFRKQNGIVEFRRNQVMDFRQVPESMMSEAGVVNNKEFSFK